MEIAPLAMRNNLVKPIATHRRISTSAPQSANTRLRQLATQPLGLYLTALPLHTRPYAVTRNPANARLPFQAKSPALAGRCVRLGLISLAGCEVTTVGRIASDH